MMSEPLSINTFSFSCETEKRDDSIALREWKVPELRSRRRLEGYECHLTQTTSASSYTNRVVLISSLNKAYQGQYVIRYFVVTRFRSRHDI